MDFEDTPEEARFRAEITSFLDEHSPGYSAFYGSTHDIRERAKTSRAWQALLFEHGWAVPSWPQEWGGRGLSPAEHAIWGQECAKRGVGPGSLSPGLSMLGPTLAMYGTEDQKKRFLEPTARGDILWAQLFSEPGAGSDLASLATRAVRDGDNWIVNGQKVWSSFAFMADFGFLLVRDDPAKPKHAGITYLLLDMTTPGIEVRPLVEMTGGTHFSEVFFSDVVVPDDCRVGQVGGGWPIARTTLGFERSSIGGGSALDHFERLKAVIALRKREVDPVTASEIAELYTQVKALDLLNKRVMTELSHGRTPGAESTIMKNAISDVMIRVADLGMRLLGEDALDLGHSMEHAFLFAPSMDIGGGTREVMKNLVAEQVLGLPREPDAMRGESFEAIPRS